jgi:hypothetical protein
MDYWIDLYIYLYCFFKEKNLVILFMRLNKIIKVDILGIPLAKSLKV